MFRTISCLATIAAILLSGSAQTFAQDAYPSRRITAIVPLVAGGNGDAVARIYASALEKELKQTVIVDNRPGAGGTIGVTAFARSAPDGYTIMIFGAGSVSKSFFKDLTVDVKTDITPVIQIAAGSYFLVGNDTVKTWADFVALLNANPGKINYASTVSSQFLLVELIKQKAGLDITNVPYKGVGQARQALIVNDVTMYPDAITGLEGFVADGKMNLLAVADDKRSSFAPNVPTLTELGVPGNIIGPYNYAVWVPKGTPQAIVDTLNTVFNKINKDPEVLSFLKKAGLDPVGGAPSVHADSIKREHALWAEAAKAANYEPQ